MSLLTREQFKRAVFNRDKHTCVVPNCGFPAIDAHHILDRKLWADGGYYINNGASVCAGCHLQCEIGEITVEQIRHYAGITLIMLPDGLDPDLTYDKWGKVMGQYFKFPKTYHLPWSPGLTNGDKILFDLDELFNGEIIITEKMDGENTTMYRDHIHARSIDSKDHPSRSWVKGFWASIKNDIPEGYRICGENMFAKHSILYEGLPSYFLGFSVWNEKNDCLSWKETLEYFDLLGISPVPGLFKGTLAKEQVIDWWNGQDLYLQSFIKNKEGYVVRRSCQFKYPEYKHMVAKYVRANHVQTDEHWLDKPIERNGLFGE